MTMTEKLDTNIWFAISCKFISVLLKRELKSKKKTGRIQSIHNFILNSVLDLLLQKSC
jgi:hypothetical protein